MARDEHRIRLQCGDAVVLSARLIPGNARDVYRVVNALSAKGVRVLRPEVAEVHASGHAAARDLLKVIELTKPNYLMPVHGEWRHLQAHAELGRRGGLDDESIILIRNGDVVDLIRDVALVAGSFPYVNTYVDGDTLGRVSERTLEERRRLADSGVISASLALGDKTGDL